MNANVEYRDIPGFPGYRIGDDGTVWSQWKICQDHLGRLSPCMTDEWRQRKPDVTKKGYHSITLKQGAGSVRRPVHQLVLEVFVGPRPPGMECRHLNGVKDDNRPVNLVWGTPLDNAQDKWNHGTMYCGERCKRAVLDSSQVLEIRRRHKVDRVPYRILATDFGISQDHVAKICQQKRWAHLQEVA